MTSFQEFYVKKNSKDFYIYKSFVLFVRTFTKYKQQTKKQKYMEIKVLGTGCPKCKALTKAVEEVINETGVYASVTKVEDINDIMQHGVMVTPALVVNGKVVASGKVPKKEEIKKLLN